MNTVVLGFTAAVFASSAAVGQIATLNIRVHKDNALVNPAPGTLVDVTGDTPVSGPTSHDDNGDTITDRVSYIYNVVSGVTLSLLSGPGESVDRWERKVSSTTFVSSGAPSISFFIGSNTDVDLYLVNSALPETEPVSCRVAPDANTLTGAPVVWGEAFHTASRRTTDPGDPAYPVNFFSGEFTERMVDLQVRGRGLDFVWSRRYRSREGKSARLGNNWDHSYNISVENRGGPVGGEKAVVHMGNGRAELFTEIFVPGLVVHSWAKGLEAELTRDILNGSQYKLRFGNGTVWIFDNGGGPAKGKIARIADRYGNTLSFAYDGAGRLTTITDTLGRAYVLAYGSDDLIDSITESNGLGRSIAYSYYVAGDSGGTSGDLKQVTYPDSRNLTYTYDTSPNASFAGNLLSIQDGQGNVVMSAVYDSNDRTTSQTWGNGADASLVTIDYASTTGLQGSETLKRIVKDGEGNVSEVFYNASNQLLRKREYTGRAVATAPTTETLNRPSAKVRPGDPAYFETTFAWNVHDLLTQQVNPSGNSVAFTYGNAETRSRIAEVTRIDRVSPGGSPTLHEDFAYKNDWSGNADKFTACRCGEAFVSRHNLSNESNQVNLDVAFHFGDDGSRTGVSYGDVNGFPGTDHDVFAYNSFGQVESHTHPDSFHYRRVDNYSYYSGGSQNGSLSSMVIDPGTPPSQLNLADNREYDSAGRLIRYAGPAEASGITTGADPGEYLLTYNSNDEIVSAQSPQIGGSNSLRNQTDFIYDANGNVIETRVYNFDQTGTAQPNTQFTTTYTYDTLNRPVQTVREVDNASSITTDVKYDRNGNVILARNGTALDGSQPTSTVNFAYDERNLLYRRIAGRDDPKQLTTQFDYDVNGNLTAQTDGMELAAGQRHLTTTAYDGFDRAMSVTGPQGDVTQYAYDGAGKIVNVKVKEGGSLTRADVTYVYDKSSRNTAIQQKLLDRNGNQLTGIGGGSSDTTIQYTDASLPINVIFEGNTTIHIYDRVKRPFLVIDPSGNSVVYAYDANSNLASITRTEKNDLGQPDQIFKTQFAYDRLDRRTLEQERYSTSGGDQFNNTSYAYDSRDNMVLTIDPRNIKTTHAYDGLNRRTASTFELSPAGATISSLTGYDANGRVVSRTDPNGNVTRYGYDAFGRATAVVYADGSVESQQYDLFGNAAGRTDAAGTVFTNAYDKLGRLTGRTTAAASGFASPGAESFGYDALSRLVSAVDADSAVTFGYDSLGSLELETLQISGGPLRTVSHVNDDRGNRLSTVYPGARSLAYTPDALDRVKTIVDTTGGGSLALAAYDYVGGRVARRTYSAAGTQLDYAYDGTGANAPGDFGAGNRTNTGYAMQGADAALNNYTATPIDDRGYDVLGNLGSFDARARWYTFDTQNRLTSYVTAGARTPDTITVGGNYTVKSGTWSVSGGVLSETSAATGRILRSFPAGTQEISFSYRSPHDAANTTDYDPERYGLAILRLLEPNSPAQWRYVALAIEPTGLYLREWQDDALLGERASAGVAAAANTWYDVKVAYSGTNNTTLTVYWAKRGQPLKQVMSAAVSLAEDPAQEIGFGVGQLGDYEFRDVVFRSTVADTSTVQVTYQYDALGRRIARTVDPNGVNIRTEFLYDGAQIIEERNGAGAVQATYAYGTGVDEVLNMQRGGNDYYYHADDLGNIVAITNNTGAVIERYDYEAFGKPTATSSIGNPYFFNGRPYDAETGLYFYRSRYMDPQAGRFVSRDTIGLYGDANNLGNGQAYLGNNPWSDLDPFGEGGLFQQSRAISEQVAGRRRTHGPDKPLPEWVGRAGRVAGTGAVVGLNAAAWVFGTPIGGSIVTGLTVSVGGATSYYSRQAQFIEATGRPMSAGETATAVTSDLTGMSSVYAIATGQDALIGSPVSGADRLEMAAHLGAAFAGGGLGYRGSLAVRASGAVETVPIGSQLLLPNVFDSTGPGLSANVSLSTRVAEIHGVLHPIAQAQRTTAILETSNGTRIVAGGARDLAQAQRQFLAEGEVAARLPGAHAEITALVHASQYGLTPLEISSSRPICPDCAAAIRAAGGTITSPTTGAWLK